MAAIFTCQHRVSYADCTVGNHVYYARYLDFLETTRGEFFRHLGTSCLQLQELDTLFPVVECLLRYKSPARYDQTLTIELQVTTAAGPRLNFAYRILDETGALKLEAETHHVCTSLHEKPKRLPKELLSLLEPYLPSIKPASDKAAL
jgi:acyl-CoA thioester hydrolase